MIRSESALISPALRATFSESGLVLTAWFPWLIQRGGRDGNVVRKHVASPTVFDLTIAREKNEDGIWVATELFVTEVVPADDDAPRRTLLSWAAALDYRCVWWGNELIVNREHGCGLGGVWRSGCSTCGSDWSDDTYSFWMVARGAGYFPLDCTLCGHALPQPSLQTDPATVAGARTVTARDASTRSRPGALADEPRPR